jgi:hypothetical protein
MAQSLPDLSAGEAEVREVRTEDGYTEWSLSVTVRNSGRLPTALRQADLVKIVRPDRLVLSFEDGVRVGGDSGQVRFLDDEGNEVTRGGQSLELGYLQPGEEREVEMRFRTYELDAFSGSWELLSTRGGVLRGTFEGG